MPAAYHIAIHEDADAISPGGPFGGLTHQTLSNVTTGANDASLWRHQFTEKLTVPPHYHTTDETIVVLRGSARFRVGTPVFEYTAGADPYANAAVEDCPAASTIVVPANTLHGFTITETPAEILIFMADPRGATIMPDGNPMPLPWAV